MTIDEKRVIALHNAAAEIVFIRGLGTWSDHSRGSRREILLKYRRTLDFRRLDFVAGDLTSAVKQVLRITVDDCLAGAES